MLATSPSIQISCQQLKELSKISYRDAVGRAAGGGWMRRLSDGDIHGLSGLDNRLACDQLDFESKQHKVSGAVSLG